MTGRIEYPDIVDICHHLNMTDEEIKNLPDEAVAELNALGALSQAAEHMFDPEIMAAEHKRDMTLVNFLAAHEDPFKLLYEATKK